MQVPYIDDRRIVLYGKVTAVLKYGNATLLQAVEAIMCFVCFLTLLCFPLQAFGGYLTLKMLAATDKLFQCTAAVAPITDFRLYSELRSYCSSHDLSLVAL